MNLFSFCMSVLLQVPVLGRRMKYQISEETSLYFKTCSILSRYIYIALFLPSILNMHGSLCVCVWEIERERGREIIFHNSTGNCTQSLIPARRSVLRMSRHGNLTLFTKYTRRQFRKPSSVTLHSGNTVLQPSLASWPLCLCVPSAEITHITTAGCLVVVETESR